MFNKHPKADLKKQSRIVIEQALALSLACILFGFLSFPSMVVDAYIGSVGNELVNIEMIPETEQLKKIPPPQRPQIPIPTESEDIFDDVAIMDTELDLNAPPPPPPFALGGVRVGSGESSPFLTWEEAPNLIKIVVPDYPLIAKRAGVVGSVILLITIDENGNVSDPEVVIARLAGLGFEDAAVAAILQWKFTPAKQRDKAIRVRMRQQINFTLRKKW